MRIINQKLKKNFCFGGVLFCSAIILACSVPPKTIIELQPQVNISHSSIGLNKSVNIKVIDARQDNPYTRANIDPAENVTQIFAAQLQQGLEADNFNVTRGINSQVQSDVSVLTLKILSINHATLSGYVSSNTQTFVSVQVNATRHNEIYTKVYNASAYNDNYLSAIKQTPSEQVNLAVSKLLSNILNDQSLLRFLAD